MKLMYVEACGFRGYRKAVRLNLGEHFTIIDGRNGTGKSTVFDAVEFALTGQISKYDDAKAAGESVADYVWWKGDGFGPSDRYVEVGFRDGHADLVVRRTHLSSPDKQTLEAVTMGLCDLRTAPEAPLAQLCSATIIRDEHITSLSLDLKEVDRYALLRATLGASDSDKWIQRAAQLVSAATQRQKAAEAVIVATNGEVANAMRRLDEIRQNLAEESVLSAVVERLREFAKSADAPDQLAGPVRQRLADAEAERRTLSEVAERAASIDASRAQLPQLLVAMNVAREAEESAKTALDAQPGPETPLEELSQEAVARSILELIAAGRDIGLQDGRCPLCASSQTVTAFEAGLRTAEEVALRLNAQASVRARVEHERARAEAEWVAAAKTKTEAVLEHEAASAEIEAFDASLTSLRLTRDGTAGAARQRADELQMAVEAARRDLRVLETLELNVALENGRVALTGSKERLERAQDAYGRAQGVLATAQALHDAARRAAAETLDQRLERVLPLMAELYRRLRPHPVWNDIEYSIRGDVKRFLKLKVGEDLNPQFLFSSGQRRATGIAFLLSINLSLAWSRWRSILLDDPVQHVDDFRAVHLAELAAQLVADGRQIVCAVEDAALADLLCRRLPVEKAGVGKRVTLGHDAEGALTKIVEQDLLPMSRHALSDTAEARVAS